MSLEINKNIVDVHASPTMALLSKIVEYKQKGIDVIALNVGEPDFTTPKNVIEAIKKALDEGKTKYLPVQGLPELRELISKKLKDDNNLDYPANQIVVCTGAKQALFNLNLLLLNQGDEIIIPAPCWSSYIDTAKAVGGVPIVVNTKDDWQLDVDAIEKAITNKTKCLLINTPNNPTGVVYHREDLQRLANLAIKHQFYIIADEVYEKLIFDNVKHESIGSFSKEIHDLTITVNGFSKAYAMTGLRIGYAALPSKYLADKFIDLHTHLTSNSTSVIQYGAIEALKGDQSFVSDMAKEFKKRRDLCMSLLSEIADIEVVEAHGAFYLMIKVDKYFNRKYQNYVIKNADDLSMYLLEEAHIAIISAVSFAAKNYLRLAYSNSTENLTKAIKAMKDALHKLK
ncbi:MAG: pyridoxal phosphate-dependent aminotransferase [Bacilli bacterium]|jgi:aspartate aminotransferase|nr:pyridoxal phosphate-dependent aminotransferase [Bacilli bacterium]